MARRSNRRYARPPADLHRPFHRSADDAYRIASIPTTSAAAAAKNSPISATCDNTVTILACIKQLLQTEPAKTTFTAIPASTNSRCLLNTDDGFWTALPRPRTDAAISTEFQTHPADGGWLSDPPLTWPPRLWELKNLGDRPINDGVQAEQMGEIGSINSTACQTFPLRSCRRCSVLPCCSAVARRRGTPPSSGNPSLCPRRSPSRRWRQRSRSRRTSPRPR